MKNEKYRIAFVSTNGIYSGSEVLMFQTATYLSSECNVFVLTKYRNIKAENFTSNKIQFFNISDPNSLIKKIKNKLTGNTNDFKLNLIKIRPCIVVISQGSPLASLKEMEICIALKIKFIIINQLVSDYHWSQYNDNLFLRLKNAYNNSESVFFVSKQNEELFKVFFGNSFISKQINNPIDIKYNGYLSYPSSSIYKIAFVGRIEFYHKGLDLLIEVLRNPIWLSRNIEFNFYGSGPHERIFKELIKRYKINFCKVKSHTSDLIGVWSENHLAILPSRFEGKSLSISEAMSLGRGVIATNVGGVKEQIEDGISGFICVNFSVESLSETLERAWENKDKWQQIGINARNKFMKENLISPNIILAKYISDNLL